MHDPYRARNWPEWAAQRIVRRFLISNAGIWFGRHVLPRLDRPLLYLSRGRISTAPNQPILLLVTLGARSRKLRATPLLYQPDGERIILVASNGGRDRHPAWYYNLRAHPEAVVYLGGRITLYRAHEAGDDERATLWSKVLSYYEGLALYEQRTTRNIPVFVLEPVRAPSVQVASGDGAPAILTTSAADKVTR